MKLTIIMPIFNEEENLEKAIVKLCNKVKRQNFKIVMVYDTSFDNTYSIAYKLTQRYSNVYLLNNPYSKAGIGWALKAGFETVKEGVVIPVMADLCDSIEDIEKMVELFEENKVDVICGSRYMKGGKRLGESKLKAFFSFTLGGLIHFLIKLPTHDAPNTFKMYKKEVLEQLEIKGELSFALSMSLILQAYFKGYKIIEIPTIWQGREKGHSKFKILKIFLCYFRVFLWAFFKKISIFIFLDESNSNKKN